MLTTTTRNIMNIGLGGIYVAHVIRTTDDLGKSFYVLGLSFGNGQAIGMVTEVRGNRLRSFTHLSAVEEYLEILSPHMILIAVYPAEGPLQEVKDTLIETYHLDNALGQNAILEIDRLRLLSALAPDRANTDERDQDPADP